MTDPVVEPDPPVDPPVDEPVEPEPAPVCPTPTITAYPSERVAQLMAGGRQRVAYECPAGHWHLRSSRVIDGAGRQ